MSRAASRALTAALGAALLFGVATEATHAQARLSLGGGRSDNPDEFRRADSSKVIAAELAFARLAQEKGQWTAFAETSADDAVMFVPEPVNAHDWLKGRANPPQSVRWQPHQVWSSCDGTLAVTKGAWQRPNGTVGYFTTVWSRQRDGDYKWVMDQGDGLEQALAEPEFIGGDVAECTGRERPLPRSGRDDVAQASVRAPACKSGSCQGGGTSADGTLSYEYSTTAQGRQFTVQLRKSGAMSEVLRSEVSAE